MGLQHISTSPIRRFLAIVGLLALMLTLSAWSYPSGAIAKGAEDSTSFIRLIHASPDIGIVDVFVDGKKLLSSFQFATVTEYVPLPGGNHKIQVALLGKGVNAAALTQTINMQPNVIYTVAALGTKASGFSLHIFTDDNTVANTNKAKLRVYHLSPGTQPVNINEGGNTLVRGLGYEQSSSYVALPAGQYQFNVSGGTAGGANTLQATLKPWTVTSIFAIGVLNGTPKLQFVTAQVQGIPLLPSTGSDPTVRVTEKENSSLPIFWLAGVLAVILLSVCARFYLPVRQAQKHISSVSVRHIGQEEK